MAVSLARANCPVMDPASRRPPPLRVCLTGSSYWIRHLAALLGRESARVRIVGVSSPWRLLYRPDLCLGADMVIRVGFPPVRPGAKFRIFETVFEVLTRLRGTRVVSYWIGSDVELARATFKNGGISREDMRRLRNSRHLIGAPWFRDALAELGICPELAVFPGSFPEWHGPLALPERFSVLSYVPEGGEDLYGLDVIIELAKRLPRVRFAVMAHRGLEVPPLDNVTFLGYLADPHSAMRACTVVLRMTRSDAIGGTVREGLFWGRHVIFTHPVPHTLGVAYGDVGGAERHLRDLLEQHEAGALEVNAAGRDYALLEFDADRAIATLVDKLQSLTRPSPSENRE